MDKLKKTTKIIFFLIAFGVFLKPSISPAEQSVRKCTACGRLSNFSTPQLIKFIDIKIEFLKSSQNPNKKHLERFSRCKRTLDTHKNPFLSGKKLQDLKICRSLMNHEAYESKKVPVKLTIEEMCMPAVDFQGCVNEMTKKKEPSSKNEPRLILF